MIKIHFTKNSNNEYVKVKATGHADRRPSGEEDALCAGVSVLLINTVNSLEKLAGANVSHKTNNDGYLEFEIISTYNDKIKILMDSLVLGLTSIYDADYMSLYL